MPYAMLAPAPPRCCTRSSTRKDSETLPIWPSTNCSVKVPGKVIRWSVAMEPVTTTGTSAPQGRQPARRPTVPVNSRFPRASPPVGVRELTQCAPQRDAELQRADEPEEDTGSRTADDDGVGVGGRGDHAGAAQGESGERHAGRPLPDADRTRLRDARLTGPRAQVVGQPAQRAEGHS